MRPTDEPDPSLTPEDRRLIDAIDASFRPRPMSPARQAAFRRELEQRLARPSRPLRWALPGLAACAAAVAAFWFGWSGALIPDAERERSPTQLAANSPRSEALEAFVDPDYTTAEYAEEYLPEDYRVLASAFEIDTSGP